MRGRKTLQDNEAAIEFVPASIMQPLDFREVFARDAPVEIDAGCGDGAFLTALAAQNPDRNFLGIERLLGRVRSVCRKVAKLELANVRVLRMEVTYAITRLISPGTVRAFHVLFPDPWPKRRHHRRRTVTPGLVAAMHRALVADGLLDIATDDADYFREINRVLAEGALFEYSSAEAAFPRSAFEQHFVASGTPIHRLLLRMTSPVR